MSFQGLYFFSPTHVIVDLNFVMVVGEADSTFIGDTLLVIQDRIVESSKEGCVSTVSN